MATTWSVPGAKGGTQRTASPKATQRTVSQPPTKSTADDKPPVPDHELNPGRLAPIAPKILMMMLYGARSARPDLLRAIAHLARFLTKWCTWHDDELNHLVSYVSNSLGYRHFGYMDQKIDIKEMNPHLFADAAFADDVKTSKSTSGAYMTLRTALTTNGREEFKALKTDFPLGCASQSQSCQAHSTPEAELVAMDAAIRKMGIPSLILWNKVLRRKDCIEEGSRVIAHEDNSAMIKVCEHGRNPTMRHLGRTHGISVALLHELFQRWEFRLEKEPTDSMCADIFTKPFLEFAKWEKVLDLINITDFSKIKITPSLWKWNGVDPHASNDTGTPDQAHADNAYAESYTENGTIGHGSVTPPKKKRKKTSKAKKKQVQITETSAPITVVDTTDDDSSQESCWSSDREWTVSAATYQGSHWRKKMGKRRFPLHKVYDQ